LPDTTPEEKYKNFEATPLYNREMEYYINPVKPGWQKRYYKGLFDINISGIDSVAINYLEGLEWTMKYYTTGCADWRWKYKYNYPPLLNDLLKHIPLFEREFVPNKMENPVSELVQLCYVLPRTSLSLLPNKLRFELLRRYDNWYKGNCDFVWAYCKYFWESHVEMNDIDLNELECFIANNRHLLT
jgi:5'-3' exonuclease